jgi:hypothetical protein
MKHWISSNKRPPNTRVQRTRVARCARPGSPLTRHPLGGPWTTRQGSGVASSAAARSAQSAAFHRSSGTGAMIGVS